MIDYSITANIHRTSYKHLYNTVPHYKKNNTYHSFTNDNLINHSETNISSVTDSYNI